MNRSGAARALEAIFTLLAAAALPLVAIGAMAALPAMTLGATPVAWLPTALAGALALTATIAALAWLVSGLRRGSVSSIAAAGSSAALAGGAVASLAGAIALAAPIAAAATFALVAVLADRMPPIAERGARLGMTALALALAEAAVLVAIVPALADAASLAGQPLLVGTAMVGIAAAALSGVRRTALGTALIAVAAVGLAADRGGSMESVIALLALIGSQLVALRIGVDPVPSEEDGDAETRLPDLAARLSDAVLGFDGRLQLRDWNAAAASLLGLDVSSVGTRMEDLLGVPMSELPASDGGVMTRRAVGGLEVAIHRSGTGVTAVVHDPGATPEPERLGMELRSTIEELLRARRTIDLQRGELERSSTVDPLTGVASRGAIIERLRIEVAQARRYRHPLAIVLIDVDGFSDLNRLHGIGGGDAVLREVALRVRLRVREADALGRAGSDGFLAVLPHTDEGGAATFADALRHRLALRPVAVGDSLVPVTVSIGVATMRPGEDVDLDAILARVEEALTSARTAGGDRIALDRLHGLARLEDPHASQRPSADETAQDSGR
jgi:diguanylate cyclase (GGDEF)-like protein